MGFIKWLQSVVEAIFIARERARDAIYDAQHKKLARLREKNRRYEEEDVMRQKLHKQQELIYNRMFK